MRELDLSMLRDYPLPVIAGGSKETRGRVLIVGGHPHVPGAPLLAAEASLRAGAGRLQIAVPAQVVTAAGVACPEALVAPFSMVPSLIDDCDAVSIGPGTFDDDEFAQLCARVAERYRGALTFDAGAFSALKRNDTLLHNRTVTAVITPHLGELSLLVGVERDAVEADAARYTREAAKRFGCIVVGKGDRTVIARPDGEAVLFRGGTVALAVSGSGDVLSGLLAGLLARAAEPFTAALWAVAAHGEAGRRLEEAVGIGLLARELPAQVPLILREWSTT